MKQISTNTDRKPMLPLLPGSQSCSPAFLNQVIHADFLNNELPDKCAQLIIADPPYFEVKGEFDFIWKSFCEYLKDVEQWAIECKRILADGGTLLWYGHAKKIAYTQIILDKIFTIENNIAIEFNRQTKKGVENFRCFAPVSERLLMYSNGNVIGEYLKRIIESKGLKYNDIDIELGYVRTKNKNRGTELCRRWIEGSSIPSVDDLINIQNYFDIQNNELINKERYFNNQFGLFDVMKFDQEAHITQKYEHDTCKPETLTRALILTCSRENDLIVVPFSGSGTECAMATKEKRKAIGFDIKAKYVDMSNARIKEIVRVPTLF